VRVIVLNSLSLCLIWSSELFFSLAKNNIVVAYVDFWYCWSINVIKSNVQFNSYNNICVDKITKTYPYVESA
jgi:hypothetical protein